MRKACGRSPRVSVYAFSKSADTWWKINGEAISALPRASVWKFDWGEVQALAQLARRTMALSISIVGGVIYLDSGGDNLSLTPTQLLQSES